jgi:phosphonopyruvate decarboxylase
VLEPREVFEWLAEGGVGFYAGVPDSLLKDFCAYVTANTPASRHVITANEGSAVAMAMGYHLATGKVGAVYLQNSGLGNTVNPLTSLADPAIYGVPMLLIVGWRGEPGKKDEPQHVHMGRVTLATLAALEIGYEVLPAEPAAARAAVGRALAAAREREAPFALVVQNGVFSSYGLPEEPPRYPLTREEAIGALVAALPADAVVVATTGKPSRELFELRQARGQAHDGDLLIVGGMGHASQIALGVALQRPERPVYCLDGDGAVLMHMGGLATIGAQAPPRYRHVVVNNAAHDSVGGQPTVAFDVDLCAVARACGYPHAERVERADDLPRAVAALEAVRGPAMLEVRVQKGSRANLGRPTTTPAELKRLFMRRLGTAFE